MTIDISQAWICGQCNRVFDHPEHQHPQFCPACGNQRGFVRVEGIFYRSHEEITRLQQIACSKTCARRRQEVAA